MTKRRLLPLLLCASRSPRPSTPLPRAAHASTTREPEAFNSDKFWTYAACAASIALAPAATGGWILVGIACGKAATTYWTT